MPQAWFEARHLDYAYANGPLVVRSVNVTSIPGSMTAVIGANGSAKSTLIRMLAGLLKPLAGTIMLDGVALNDWQPRLRAREVAYVPQSTAAVARRRRISPCVSTCTSSTSAACVPKLSCNDIPRAQRGGSGSPHPENCAALFSTASERESLPRRDLR